MAQKKWDKPDGKTKRRIKKKQRKQLVAAELERRRGEQRNQQEQTVNLAPVSGIIFLIALLTILLAVR